jgi:hypothetical protein
MRVCEDRPVPTPFTLLTKRTGTIGLFLTAYDIWRRLPESQRRAIIQATREHGPRLARAAAERRKPRPPKP